MSSGDRGRQSCSLWRRTCENSSNRRDVSVLVVGVMDTVLHLLRDKKRPDVAYFFASFCLSFNERSAIGPKGTLRRQPARRSPLSAPRCVPCPLRSICL